MFQRIVLSSGRKPARGDRQSHASRKARRQVAAACVEALDRRLLLSAAFQFTISDPTNAYHSIDSQLQTLLNAAGGEWAQYLNVPTRDVTLQYNVSFTSDPAPDAYTLLTGAAKSGQIIGTDPNSGATVYQLGTVTKILTGNDPNGNTPDATILIYGQNIRKFYFDPYLNRRTDPIPDGMVDGYSAILQAMARTLGFVSTRNALGDVSSVGEYGYDEHVNVNSPGRYTFGSGSETYDPTTGTFVIDDSSDNAYKAYYGSVPLQVGDPETLSGTDLDTDLMSGEIQPGQRYTVSHLDLAILQDSGTPVNLDLAANPVGLYTVNGTGLSDKISVILTNHTLLIRVNDAVTTFTPDQGQQISAIVINGLAGNDVIDISNANIGIAINGGAGNDTIIGSSKADSLSGSGGNDLIYGGGGGDIIHGGDGKDVIYGQGGADRLFGDGGNDFVDGGEQTDRINGGSGNDTLVGNTGDDFLYGDNGNDLLSGAGGKDRMDGGAGADTFYGGGGNDSVDYSSRTDVGIVAVMDQAPDSGAPGEGDVIMDAENIIGTPFADVIVGNGGPNSLMGGGGNDTIDGGGGADTLEGNAGDDSLTGSGGNDSLLGGDGNDTIIGGTGQDYVFGDTGNDTILVNDGEIDTVDGGIGSDSVTADANDVLSNVESTTFVQAGAVLQSASLKAINTK